VAGSLTNLSRKTGKREYYQIDAKLLDFLILKDQSGDFNVGYATDR
jgi:hypothetical protein